MTPREFVRRLDRRARRAELEISTELAEKLRSYYELLARWNQKINLTSFPLENAPDDALDRLLVEPLVAAKQIPPGTRSVVDIGSGGGSPAIPFKLARPDLRLTMIEVKVRKCAFLREAARTLELAETMIENARFEELLTRPELHEAFDLELLRAVRVEGRVLRTIQAFLRPGGQLFLFRGPSGDLPDPLAPLAWRETRPLVPSSRSRLVILEKSAVPS